MTKLPLKDSSSRCAAGKLGILAAGICLLFAASAHAQPAEQKPNVVRAEAPVVAGNALNAKKLALANALRQAVEQAYGELVKEGEPLPPSSTAAQLRATLASSPQKFVRSYRLIEEQREGGVLRVMVEVDVDTVVLRREVDRARGAAAAQLRPLAKPAANLLFVAGSAPAVGLVVVALGPLGVRGQLDPAPAEAQLLANAARQSAYALFLVAQSSTEDKVRGAFRVPVKCSLGWRLFSTGFEAGRGPFAARTDQDFGFGSDEASARNACFESAAQTVARAAVAAMRAPATSAPYVTLKLDIPDVGAIPLVLQALKRLGSSAANEVRHVTANAAEIRVFTRTGGPLLLQALTRELGGKYLLSPVQTAIDLVVVKMRAADAPPSEEKP
jgi:hypothetical protein